MKKYLSLLLILSSFIALPAFAENTQIGEEYPSIMRGVRPLGMGNAFLTMPGTDYNAQYYNPAAINDFEKKLHMTFVNPMVDLSVDSISIIQDIKELSDDLDDAATDNEKTDVFNQFVDEHTGEFHHLGLGVPIVHVRHKYFAVGLIADSRTGVSFRDTVFNNFDVRSVDVAGITGGSAYSFFDGDLQVGGNVKILYKATVEQKITINDILNNDLGDFFKWGAWDKGYGVGVDVGAKYALPVFKELLRPTVGLTVQDVANTRFSGGAPSTPMSVSMGAGVYPKAGKFQFAVLADFREIEKQMDILKKVHFGAEALSPKVAKMQFALRAGMNQGYFAVGGTAHFPIVKLDVAYYGEEVGEVNRSKGSYRLAGQLQFGF